MLTKQEQKQAMKYKIKVLRWDLSTYRSCKAIIKAIDEEIARINSISFDSAPPTDNLVAGKLTGARATEYDSAVEYVGIKVGDLIADKEKFEGVIEKIDVAMDNLTEADRKIIDLIYFQGFTYAMIGKDLGYSISGMKKKTAKILAVLSEYY